MKLRDTFWLWGHPEGRYNNNIDNFGFHGFSRMTPMEGCLYLGIKNTFMVPCDWPCDRDQYNKSFKTLNKVGWEFTRKMHTPELIDEYINDAKKFSNINCVVFDDFKGLSAKHKDKELFIENLKKVIDKLHNNDVKRLDVWMVLYTHEFGIDEKVDAEFAEILKLFDGIIMWNWYESRYKEIPEKFEIFKKLTPNNRRMFGCYLYNFGEKKQATGEAVKWQLDFYREKMLAGEAEGVVPHTNTMADMDFESYDVFRAWIAEHGDEEISVPTLEN